MRTRLGLQRERDALQLQLHAHEALLQDAHLALGLLEPHQDGLPLLGIHRVLRKAKAPPQRSGCKIEYSVESGCQIRSSVESGCEISSRVESGCKTDSGVQFVI